MPVHVLLALVLADPSSEPASFAATEDTADIFDVLEEEVVVSAGKHTQRVDEVAWATEVITGEDIRRSGLVYLPEILRRHAGIDVAQTTYSDFKVGVRGNFGVYNEDRVLLLIDGRPQQLDAWGAVSWNQITVPLEDIERIEIVRGPSATLYGGNGLTGLINIITRKLADTPRFGFGMSAGPLVRPQMRAPNAIWRNYFVTAGEAGDRNQHRLRVSFTQLAAVVFGDPAQPRTYIQSPTAAASGEYEYAIDTKRRFGFNYGGNGAARAYTPNTLVAQPLADQLSDISFGLSYAQDDVALGGNLLVRGSYRVTMMRAFERSPIDLPDGLVHTAIVDATLSALEAGSHLLTFGFDARYSSTDWAIVQKLGRNALSAGLYGQDDWKVHPNVNLTGGLRVGLVGYPGSGQAVRPIFAPKLGVAWALSKQHTLRLATALAQRAPSQIDLFALDYAPLTVIGNPALRVETLWSLDLGYTGRFFGGAFELVLNAFVNVLDGGRDTNDQVLMSQTNALNLVGFGGEASAILKPADGLKVSLNYSHASYYDRTARAGRVIGPPNRANLVADVDFGYGITINGAVGFTDQASYFTATATSYPLREMQVVPARFVADTAVIWKSGSGWTLGAYGNNLGRFARVQRVEYPGGAEPIGARVMLMVGYTAPALRDAPTRNGFETRWWAKALAVGFMGLSAALTTVIGGNL